MLSHKLRISLSRQCGEGKRIPRHRERADVVTLVGITERLPFRLLREHGHIAGDLLIRRPELRLTAIFSASL